MTTTDTHDIDYLIDAWEQQDNIEITTEDLEELTNGSQRHTSANS